MSKWLSVIGMGEDGLDGLSPCARNLLAGAEVIVGSKRLLTL
jgi:precorrin-6Y C5,15-methyltransferase (decarboxylating)